MEWCPLYGPSRQVDYWGQNHNDGNKETLNTYWGKFEEYIHPQTNKLIAVVELKWLFQGPMSLEDFHTKAMRLFTQAGYEGDAKDQVLRDTIISGMGGLHCKLAMGSLHCKLAMGSLHCKLAVGSLHCKLAMGGLSACSLPVCNPPLYTCKLPLYCNLPVYNL